MSHRYGIITHRNFQSKPYFVSASRVLLTTWATMPTIVLLIAFLTIFSFVLLTCLLINATARKLKCASNAVCALILYGKCTIAWIFFWNSCKNHASLSTLTKKGAIEKEKKTALWFSILQRIHIDGKRGSGNVASLFSFKLAERRVITF